MIEIKTRSNEIFKFSALPLGVQVEYGINFISYFHFTPLEAKEIAAALIVNAEQIEEQLRKRWVN